MKRKLTALLLVLLLAVTLVLPVMAAETYVDDEAAILTLSEVETLEARAAEISEQISTAGKEASGTSNMKLMMNGAITLGTLDGANVEIRERVGAENFFLFGMTEPEVSALYAKGYDTKGLSREYYEKDPQLKAAIDMVADGTFSDGDKDTYKDLVNDWLTKDYFMTLADFRAYMDIQAQIEETYRDPMKWSRMAVLNVANSGYFSSDRSIEDYLERIWHTGPLA